MAEGLEELPERKSRESVWEANRSLEDLEGSFAMPEKMSAVVEEDDEF